MTIANNIRKLRMISFPGVGGAKRCAEGIGCHHKAWYEWESGRRGIRRDNLEMVANYFGVNVEDLTTPAASDAAIKTPVRYFPSRLTNVCMSFAISYQQVVDESIPIHFYYHPNLSGQTVVSIQSFGSHMRGVLEPFISAGFTVNVLITSVKP